MSFTLIGPKTIHNNHFTTGEFFSLPEKYALQCPVITKLGSAHENLYDVSINWDSIELPELRKELLAIRSARVGDCLEENQSEELYQTLVVGEKICCEVMELKDTLVFRWG